MITIDRQVLIQHVCCLFSFTYSDWTVLMRSTYLYTAENIKTKYTYCSLVYFKNPDSVSFKLRYIYTFKQVI